jgi:glycosyltransferase involved in cell wall biosynthesis
MPEVQEIVAVARSSHFPPGVLPAKVKCKPSAEGGKLRFVMQAIAAGQGHFDMIICGHINLLPVAALLNFKVRASALVLLVYGIDVWKPHASALVRFLLGKVDAVWSISEVTRDKMRAWSNLPLRNFVILPNAIHLDSYIPGPKNEQLAARYGLRGGKVIMMLGRLSSSERYKGADEVLEVMPKLVKLEPALMFVIAGDGDDRPRLEAKAAALGLARHVVFTGFVSDAEKIDLLRLADAFVMPSRGEGFGFVFLEALACAVPVVASKVDGSREAVRNGELGRLVDPDNPAELEAAILSVLDDVHHVPDGLGYFAFPEFQKRAAHATRAMLNR